MHLVIKAKNSSLKRTHVYSFCYVCRALTCKYETTQTVLSKKLECDFLQWKKKLFTVSMETVNIKINWKNRQTV